MTGRKGPVNLSYAAANHLMIQNLGMRLKFKGKTLAEEGIEFDVWDINKLSVQLREHHELIYEFFHEGWMKAFLGERVADSFFKTFGKYNSISLIEKFHYEGPKSYIKKENI